MKKLALLVVLVAAACGGKNKGNVEDTSTPLIDPTATSGDTTDRSHEQVDPVKMEEVNSLLDRRRPVVSRCLSLAVEAGNAPKSARGKLTVSLTVGTDGKAQDVKVVKTSIESPEVQDCVKRKVAEIAFPQMNRPFETSYTYAMETN